MPTGCAEVKMVFDDVLAFIPSNVREEINEYIHRTHTPRRRVNEIRLRSYGVCSLVVSGKNVPLGSRVSKDGIRETFKRICGGAVFLHRDDMCRGFITLDGGIRVGVCAEARYDRDLVVGIGEVSSLAFRIPSSECSFGNELYARWRAFGSGGMLICSAAGEGKTSALRTLARLIGSGESPLRVVVVDERCEFDIDSYSSAHVDILRGYRRDLGIDIAIRTLGAEVLIVDEISSGDDARAMLASVGAGVTVIATAHARCFSDLMRRDYVKELILSGLFDTVSTITRKNGRFSFSIDSVDAMLAGVSGEG